MAVIEYTFYPRSDQDSLGNNVPSLLGGELGTSEITIGAANTVGVLAAPAGTAFVALVCGADCRVAMGLNPVAAKVAPKTRFLKNGGEYLFSVREGWSVAVIAAV